MSEFNFKSDSRSMHTAPRRAFLSACGALAAAVAAHGAARAAAPVSASPGPIPLPSTVSDGWPRMFADLAAFPKPALPSPDDVEAWDALRQRLAAMFEEMSRERVAATGVRSRKGTLGGVPVIWLEPPHVRRRDCLIVYAHGGAYTLGTAGSTLLAPAQMALATGLRVVSIDYTTAPRAKWERTTGDVGKVFSALYADGYAPRRIGCFGDSAGGGLLAGALLRMLDRKIPLPAAAALWSPWTDLDFQGDTLLTLAAADPIVSTEALRPSRDAYVDAGERRNPYASPVYGDYSKSYPPTLVQCGLREVLLSDSVRLYQAMAAGGVAVTLDAYEGMPHVHQTMADTSPEAQRAIAKTVAFLIGHIES